MTSAFPGDHKPRPTPLPVEDCMPGLYDCYRAVGKVESKGLDFEISGEVLPRGNLMRGYTWNKAEIISHTVDGVAGSPYNTFLPKHLLKIATMYHLPGDRWRLGGAFRLQSEITSESNAVCDPRLAETPVRLDGLGLVDQVATYGSGRFGLADRLNLIAGARVVWYGYDYATDSRSSGATTHRQIRRGEWIPYAGLTHDLNDDWSVYASYTRVFIGSEQGCWAWSASGKTLGGRNAPALCA